MELEKQGIIMNHKKIQRIKRVYAIYTRIRRVNPYKAIMKKTQEHRTFPNLVNRQFVQHTPHTVLGTDITYIRFCNTFIYLSVVKDFATGEILAFELLPHIRMDLVMYTLKSLSARLNSDYITLHSDQGFHYTNPEYIHELEHLGITQSMSRRGNCIDNAPTESFFSHFKVECDFSACSTFADYHVKTCEFMRYYNYERKQWARKKMTPVEYRNHLLLKQGV